MQAIDTVFKGYKFRSRLEARWAVFFDTLGIDFDYEPEGFNLGDAGYYLPDFWLPHLQMWFEIKPESPTHDEKIKARRLAELSGQHVTILYGRVSMPEMEYIGEHCVGVKDSAYKARLFYGNIDKRFEPITFNMRFDDLPIWLREQGIDAPDWDGTIESARHLHELNRIAVENHKTDNSGAPEFQYGINADNLLWRYKNGEYTLYWRDYGVHGYADGYLPAAYRAAQQARFEHGERP